MRWFAVVISFVLAGFCTMGIILISKRFTRKRNGDHAGIYVDKADRVSAVFYFPGYDFRFCVAFNMAVNSLGYAIPLSPVKGQRYQADF